ncbi:MAG: retron St85 family effector protein [Firmicutes bacterium]|nr:retron St85 family effector protein [Bacillota bacterium]
MKMKAFGEYQLKSIREHLDSRDSKYVTYPKFIFLCGKGFDKNIKDSYWNTNRGTIHRYMEKLLPDVNIVLSEQLWEDGFDSKIDLLTFEEFLAEVSDAIILFVESPGSFCELGAFAYADSLFSDKMIIVLDESYRDSRSFVATGPVLKASDNGSKIVYAEIREGALLASVELRSAVIDLMDAMKNKVSSINKRIINKNVNVHIGSFIPEILEIIKLAQPIMSTDLIQLYKNIKGFDTFTFVKRNGETFSREIQVGYIWKLLEVSKIIQVDAGYISLFNYIKPQSFMLKYFGNAMDRERNRIMCRKYRYGEKV